MRVVLDSRAVANGDLFVAIQGSRFDGHDFLEEVAKRGAHGALVDTSYSGPSFGLELRRGSVVAMLQEMAAEHIRNSGATVVGITGSVGKTTIKEFTAEMLSQKYRVMRSPESCNSQVGLPAAVLSSEPADIMVLEMGMSSPGELAKLAEMAQPEIVIMGRIGLAHAAFFEDLNDIARAKAEILTSPKLRYLVVHEASLAFPAISGVSVPRAIYTDGEAPFVESHLRENYRAAMCVAIHLGVSEEEIARATCTPVSRRFEKKRCGGIDFLDDSYNANGESMRAALANLPKGRRVIGVLGSMGELGKYTKEVHREVGEFARGRLDELIAIGGECSDIIAAFGKGTLCTSLDQVISEVRKIHREGDLVLLKGSNSNQLWKVAEAFE